MLGMLKTIYGRPAFAFRTLQLRGRLAAAAHSDSTHFSTSPEGFMCGVWVALEDIDADNGR